MMHDGWCPDCDLRSVVIDVDTDGEHGWATCTECGSGWVHRDEVPESVVGTAAATAPRHEERRAA